MQTDSTEQLLQELIDAEKLRVSMKQVVRPGMHANLSD